MDLYKPAAIQFYTDSLAHNFTGENQVFKNGIVHCGKRTAKQKRIKYLLQCLQFYTTSTKESFSLKMKTGYMECFKSDILTPERYCIT